jgi:hypothetical protein
MDDQVIAQIWIVAGLSHNICDLIDIVLAISYQPCLPF